MIVLPVVGEVTYVKAALLGTLAGLLMVVFEFLLDKLTRWLIVLFGAEEEDKKSEEEERRRRGLIPYICGVSLFLIHYSEEPKETKPLEDEEKPDENGKVKTD